jgi:hypothetical protein
VSGGRAGPRGAWLRRGEGRARRRVQAGLAGEEEAGGRGAARAEESSAGPSGCVRSGPGEPGGEGTGGSHRPEGPQRNELRPELKNRVKVEERRKPIWRN